MKELVTEILENDNPESVSEDDSESDDEAKEQTPSAAEIRRCLHHVGVDSSGWDSATLVTSTH